MSALPNPQVQPVPEGVHTVTPWIIVQNADRQMEFMRRAFGAVEIGRVLDPDGKIGHAEMKIGDSVVMLFDAKPNWPATPAFLRLFVPHGHDVMDAALDAGAIEITPITTHFYGDQIGRIRDPAGNIWWIQTHIEDVSPEEMARRTASYERGEEHSAMDEARESLDRELRGRVR